MILTLIGMSQVGKSYYSKMLEEQKGFYRFDCDAIIAGRIDSKLPINPNLSPTRRLSIWMGVPGDKGYEEKRDEYLKLEEGVMRDIIIYLNGLSPEERKNHNFVIDTTGSVVHLSDEIKDQLKDISDEVTYLVSSKVNEDHLLRNFLKEPKPIAFPDGIYIDDPKRGKRRNRVIAYRRLLDYRSKFYQDLGTIFILPEDRKDITTADQFLETMWKSKVETLYPTRSESIYYRLPVGMRK